MKNFTYYILHILTHNKKREQEPSNTSTRGSVRILQFTTLREEIQSYQSL
jgi:hypothetical protein